MTAKEEQSSIPNAPFMANNGFYVQGSAVPIIRNFYSSGTDGKKQCLNSDCKHWNDGDAFCEKCGESLDDNEAIYYNPQAGYSNNMY